VENKKRLRSLTRRADFLNLRAAGQSFHVNSWLLVNYQKTDTETIRCGWTIPRQVGPAVLRNRFRRWGREYLRKWAADAGLSLDMNLVFKRQAPGVYREVSHKEFDEALDKLVGRLKRNIR
jgi:ribonuclease P protein component